MRHKHAADETLGGEMSFDFEDHKSKAEAHYRGIRPTYENFTDRVRGLLTDLLADISTHEIQCRAKDVTSFGRKCSKAAAKENPASPDLPKYPDPFAIQGGITDLAGARVITYLPSTIDDVKKIIEDEFLLVEPWEDKGEKLVEVGRIGYKSIHTLVRLSDARRNLREFRQYKDLILEVQIRTILQHAWAEMEHDIRYKSVEDVPKIVGARFTALAGLIEIADREFQAIQDYDRELKQQVKQTSQLRDEGTVVRVEAPEGVDEKSFVANLPEQDSVPAPLADSRSSAKTLIAEGRFEEAVIRYSELINHEPTQFAHYLGRARAYFLAGDRSSALHDIAAAESLSGKRSHADGLRLQIEEGSLEAAPGFSKEGHEHTRRGHVALSADDAIEAFKCYHASEQAGYNPIFVNFNKAMACCLEGEYRGCRNYLSYIDPFPGTYLELNWNVLRLISFVLEGVKPDVKLKDLASKKRNLEEAKGGYSLQQSPLRFILEALRKRSDQETTRRVAPLVKLFESNESPK
jgi:ppGpp synthetase/RelA/SpoT-type nucleotidyltranferase